MPRHPKVPGGRPITVGTKLSVEEAADFDDRRGKMSRADFLRLLIKRARLASYRPEEE